MCFLLTAHRCFGSAPAGRPKANGAVQKSQPKFVKDTCNAPREDQQSLRRGAALTRSHLRKAGGRLRSATPPNSATRPGRRRRAAMSAREHSWHRWPPMALKRRARRVHRPTGRNPVTLCDNTRVRRKHEAWGGLVLPEASSRASVGPGLARGWQNPAGPFPLRHPRGKAGQPAREQHAAEAGLGDAGPRFWLAGARHLAANTAQRGSQHRTFSGPRATAPPQLRLLCKPTSAQSCGAQWPSSQCDTVLWFQ